jgi:hypothetical protein
VRKACPQHDIYSFGIIMWEILSQEVAFEFVPLKQVIDSVVVNQFRPKIDHKKINKDMA